LWKLHCFLWKGIPTIQNRKDAFAQRSNSFHSLHKDYPS
jgi:hypothetical protein